MAASGSEVYGLGVCERVSVEMYTHKFYHTSMYVTA